MQFFRRVFAYLRARPRRLQQATARLFTPTFITAFVVFYFAVALLTVVALFYSARARNIAVTLAQATIARTTGYAVAISDFSIGLFPPQLSVDGVSVRKLGSAHAFFTSKHVRVMPGIARGLAGKLAVDWLEIASPDISLTWKNGQFEEFGHLLQATPDAPVRANVPVELWGTLLTRGHIRINVPGKAVIDIRGLNILASPRATGSIPVDVVVPPIVIELPNRRVVLKDIRLGLNVKGGNLLAPKTVAVRNLQFISDAGSVQTEGDVNETGGNLKVHSNVDLGILSVLFPSVPRMSGRLALAAEIDADKEKPQVRLDLDAAGLAAENMRFGDIHAEIDASLELVTLKKIVARTMGGEATITGTIKPTLNFPAKLDVTWKGLELAEILETAGLQDPWVTLKSDGKANIEGHLLPKSPNDTLLTGGAHVDVARFISRDRSFHKGDYKTILDLKDIAIDLRLALHPQKLELLGAQLRGEPGELRCDAQFHFDQLLGFHIKGESDMLDLGALGLIAGVDIKGAGPLDFELGGPYGPPEITAKVSLDDASIEKIPLGHLDSQVKFEKGRMLSFPDAVAQLGNTTVEGSGSLDMMAGPLLNISGTLDEGDIKDLLPLMPLPAWLSTSLAGDVSGDFKLYGFAEAPNLDVNFACQHADAVEQPFEHVLGNVSLRQAKFRELSLEASIGGGDVDLTLQGPPERLSVEASLTDVPINELRFLQNARKNLGGKVSGRVSAGLGKSPLGEADLTVREFHIANGRTTEVTGKMYLKGDEIKFEASAFDNKMNAKGRASIGASPDFDFDVTLGQTPIGGLFGLPAEYDIVTSGAGSMAGPFSNLDLLTAELTLQQTNVEAPSLHASTNKATKFKLERRRVTFDDLSLVGKGLDVKVGGTVTLDGKLNVGINGSVETEVLMPFIPTVDLLSGMLPLDIRLLGSLGSPELRGGAKLQNLKMKFTFLDKPFEALEGEVTLAGDSFIFDDLTADFGEGTIEANGNVRLGAGGLASLAFSAELDDVHYTAPGDLPLVMGGKVRVETNSAKNFDVTGDVRIKELRYTHDLSLNALIPGFKRKPTQTRTLEKSDERVNFDVALVAENNIVIDNNLAKAEFKADLRLSGTNLRTGLLGTLTPLRAQIFWNGKTFQVASGSIDFIDKYQILPRADLRLTTTACAADISIDISGTADVHTIDMRGRDANGQVRREDVQSCIVLGFRQSEFSSAAGVSRIGATDAVPLGLNLLSTATGLDSKLKKIIPIDQVSFGTGYTPRATGRTRSSPRIIVVKELGGGVKFRLTSSITETDDQKLELEFPLTQFSSINTSWRNAGDITNDLGLDFKWHKEF